MHDPQGTCVRCVMTPMHAEELASVLACSIYEGRRLLRINNRTPSDLYIASPFERCCHSHVTPEKWILLKIKPAAAQI